MTSGSIDFEDENSVQIEIERLTNDVEYYNSKYASSVTIVILCVVLLVFSMFIMPSITVFEWFSARGKLLCFDERHSYNFLVYAVIGTASAFALSIAIQKARLQLSRARSATSYLHSLRDLVTLKKEVAKDD